MRSDSLSAGQGGDELSKTRAYTLIRILHVAAVQQPWYVWVENVSNILVIKEGKVWQAIQAMAKLAGFHLSWSDE